MGSSSSDDSSEWCSDESTDGVFGKGKGENRFVERKRDKKHSDMHHSSESSEENDKRHMMSRNNNRNKNWN